MKCPPASIVVSAYDAFTVWCSKFSVPARGTAKAEIIQTQLVSDAVISFLRLAASLILLFHYTSIENGSMHY